MDKPWIKLNFSLWVAAAFLESRKQLCYHPQPEAGGSICSSPEHRLGWGSATVLVPYNCQSNLRSPGAEKLASASHTGHLTWPAVNGWACAERGNGSWGVDLTGNSVGTLTSLFRKLLVWVLFSIVHGILTLAAPVKNRCNVSPAKDTAHSLIHLTSFSAMGPILLRTN